MINTDKYKRHTKGDNEVGWRIVGDNFVMNGESPSFRFIAYAQQHDGRHTLVGFSDADANLIADAPLIFDAYKEKCEEVKRLTALFEETNHHLDLMVGAFGIEALVEMVGEEE